MKLEKEFSWLRKIYGIVAKPVSCSWFTTEIVFVHSFRRRGITFAIEQNVSIDQLKAQGGWKSICYEKNVVQDIALRDSSASLIAVKCSVWGPFARKKICGRLIGFRWLVFVALESTEGASPSAPTE